MATRNVTYVTQPYMPPLEEYIPYLRTIWETRWLSNSGPFHQQFEVELAAYLGVEHLALVSSGTAALTLALMALRIGGEVITTPFTFVATTHALAQNNVTPVFVDIDPVTLNLDPEAIAPAITSRTTGIMPVHCFGTPCAIDRMQAIADDYDLKIIYDAAHAFGVRKDNTSILRAGDLSALSFHATKVFNTFEGGAVVCPDLKTKLRIDRLKNFGFADDASVVVQGSNGKMNELQAAFGLLQLKYVDNAIALRRRIDQQYRKAIDGVAGISCIPAVPGVENNFSYFPILVGDDYSLSRDELLERLQAEGIYARRYFSPLTCDLPMYRDLPSARQPMPVARRVVQQILCLPIFPDLSEDSVKRAIAVIARG